MKQEVIITNKEYSTFGDEFSAILKIYETARSGEGGYLQIPQGVYNIKAGRDLDANDLNLAFNIKVDYLNVDIKNLSASLIDEIDKQVKDSFNEWDMWNPNKFKQIYIEDLPTLWGDGDEDIKD